MALATEGFDVRAHPRATTLTWRKHNHDETIHAGRVRFGGREDRRQTTGETPDWKDADGAVVAARSEVRRRPRTVRDTIKPPIVPLRPPLPRRIIVPCAPHPHHYRNQIGRAAGRGS